jgi:hypothetical protein
VTYDSTITDPDAVASALDILMDNARSTAGILDEVGNPEIEAFYPMETRFTAAVISEKEDGSGGVVRVLLVPDEAFDVEEVTGLAAYGSQHVNTLAPDVCLSKIEVKALFDEMNPPDETEDDDEPDQAEQTQVHEDESSQP